MAVRRSGMGWNVVCPGRVTIPVLSSLLVLAGCGADVEPPRPVDPVPIATSTAAVNAAPVTNDFAIQASNSVRLQSGSITLGGDVGANGVGSGPFLSTGVALDVLSGGLVEATHNVIASSVRLLPGVVVGDVHADSFFGPGSIHGLLEPLVPLPALPAPAPVTPGSSNVTVLPFAGLTWSPGRYAAVAVNAGGTLRVPAGLYEVSSFAVGSGARVEALGAVELRVAGRLSTASGAFMGPAASAGLTATDLRVEVSGRNGTTGALTAAPKAVAIGAAASLRALLLAPNGTVTLGIGATATGALLAKDVDVGAGARVFYEDGFGAAACTPDACSDGNPCTADSCINGACAHTPVAAGVSCGDGNACNGAETCDATGACVAGIPVSCAMLDQCHVAGTCDPATGACSNPNRPNGSACDDANACTASDTCQAGACQPGSAVTLDDGNSCTTDACNAVAGVTHTPVAAGTSCADGNACNGAETCDATGACSTGTPVTCTVLDQCHVAGTCNPSTGACSNPNRPNGTSCDDANACTVSDTCQAGSCQPGSAAAIDDRNPCTADSCHPTSGVTHTPVAAGTSCADGNACNGVETCDAAGTCSAGTPVSCTALDQCHVAGTCSPATGVCSNPPRANGATCDDGSACTVTDTCQDGSCQAGSAAAIDDGNPCTADSCDAGIGVAHTPVAAGTSCTDSNACNGAETCSAIGFCESGIPPELGDANPCTFDGCDPATGATHNPLPSGTQCADADLCNGAETCDGGGACVPGAPPTVDDANPCTADSCDPLLGVVRVALPAGTSCPDSNVCNGPETCDGATACQAGAPPVVNDGNPCTADSCDSATGPVHVAVANGTLCVDADLCNGAETCQVGACAAGAPLAVDDGNSCTVDSCDPGTGVGHSPAAAGTPCGAGRACDGSGVCACPVGACCEPAAVGILAGITLDPSVATDFAAAVRPSTRARQVAPSPPSRPSPP